jgi:hypothetical protein
MSENPTAVNAMADSHGYENPFEIIDSPWGHIERWRASTLSTGTMGALAQVYDIVRADADAAVARVEETEARKALVQHLCDQIAAMQERINALADALEARHRLDAEAAAHQAAFEEEPLTLPPGQELDLEREPDPTIAADLQPAPTGELHDLHPKDEGEGDLPEPPLEADNIGDLPEELTEPSVPPGEPPKGKVYPQPIAISLNEE